MNKLDSWGFRTPGHRWGAMLATSQNLENLTQSFIMEGEPKAAVVCMNLAIVLRDRVEFERGQ